jgi:hypothetical protein
MNKFHRHLNIPDYIPNVNFSQWETEGYSWHQFHKELTFEDLGNPNIEPWLNSLGITSYWMEVFYTPPHSSGIIHSDNGRGDDWPKIIYQFGAKGSTMRWWKSSKAFNLVPEMEQYIKENFDDVKGIPGKDSAGDSVECHYDSEVLMALEKDSTIVYETEIGQASLINTGPLHSSYNPTDEKRFVVTIGLFDKEIKKPINHINEIRALWDDVVPKMENYISGTN